jgi:hypothetical protein
MKYFDFCTPPPPAILCWWNWKLSAVCLTHTITKGWSGPGLLPVDDSGSFSHLSSVPTKAGLLWASLSSQPWPSPYCLSGPREFLLDRKQGTPLQPPHIWSWQPGWQEQLYQFSWNTFGFSTRVLYPAKPIS